MFPALQAIKQYPTQIEADLHREYRIDILDWWRGKISSRKLLALLEELSDNSSLKKEFTESGWPEWVEILAKTHEATAELVGIKYATAKQPYEFMTFVAPKKRAEMYEETLQRSEFKHEVEEDLFSQLGWS